ncbi:hypothetical protein HKX42_00675 [Salinisphaera sp. USBA-960]|uniref:monovalent cation:proton antiporter family protein n=1 Tax=Salinisphaera orenii TaxID=856731 RepID=UPI000DBE2511|nr:hypothetical protein [Salifodinibacter halophilus]NNC25398.1 hypothetical protein [Salifodinibacter halophilus]
MHANDLSFVPLLIVIAISFAVPVLLSPVRRFGIPVIVGEIIAGIIVGQSGFGLVYEEPVLEVLSVFGFAYLMFCCGLEMDFSQVGGHSRDGLRSVGGFRRLVRNPFFLGVLVFVATALCSLLAGLYIWHLGLIDNPWLMALILSTTSLGVVAPVLKERGLMASRYGQTLLMCSLVADFATITLISTYVLIRRNGLSTEPLLILLLILAFVVAWQLASRFANHPPLQKLLAWLSTATSQIQVRGSLAIALVFIGLAQSLGIESILGAFLAGVIVALLAGDHGSVLKEKLEAIGYGFFIPVFFVMVGVRFDLPALLQSGEALELVILLVAIAFSVKLVGGLVLRLAHGWRETLAASTLLSARLSLIIAVATIGREIGAIGPELEAALVLTAIVTCFVSPVAFARILPREKIPAPLTLVVGSNDDATALTERLTRQSLRVQQVTDLPNAPIDQITQTPPSALVTTLRAANIQDAQAVVVMADSDTDNLQVCKIAHHIHGVRDIVAWVRDPTFNARFAAAEARVINPSNFRVLLLESLLTTGQARLAANADGGDRRTRVVKLRNFWLREQALRAIHMTPDVYVQSIERDGEVIFPGPDTVLHANDRLTLAGPAASLDETARRFARRFY